MVNDTICPEDKTNADPAGKEHTMPKNLKLKAARAEKDMTQGALAEAAGVSRQTINAIEKGEYNPTINLCRSICKILDKTLDELFWEE
jgi:putative transcriptional regulator